MYLGSRPLSLGYQTKRRRLNDFSFKLKIYCCSLHEEPEKHVVFSRVYFHERRLQLVSIAIKYSFSPALLNLQSASVKESYRATFDCIIQI